MSAGGFRMAWYTILPVVFLPAYFGIDIEASILAYFGAATDVSKPRITYEDASNATVDFDNSLGDFNASVEDGSQRSGICWYWTGRRFRAARRWKC